MNGIGQRQRTLVKPLLQMLDELAKRYRLYVPTVFGAVTLNVSE